MENLQQYIKNPTMINYECPEDCNTEFDKLCILKKKN